MNNKFNTSEENGANDLTDEQIEQAVNAGPAAVRELIARAAIAANLARQPKAEQLVAKVIISDGNGTATIMLAPGADLKVGASLYAAPATPASTQAELIPDILFDGKAVYDEAVANDPNTHPTSDNVADTLDAVVRLLRRGAKVAPASAQNAAKEAEPAAWIDQFGNVWPLGAYSPNGKPNYHDAHKRGWQPLFRAPTSTASASGSTKEAEQESVQAEPYAYEHDDGRSTVLVYADWFRRGHGKMVDGDTYRPLYLAASTTTEDGAQNAEAIRNVMSDEIRGLLQELLDEYDKTLCSAYCQVNENEELTSRVRSALQSGTATTKEGGA